MELDCNGPFGLSSDALHMCAHVKVLLLLLVLLLLFLLSIPQQSIKLMENAPSDAANSNTQRKY